MVRNIDMYGASPVPVAISSAALSGATRSKGEHPAGLAAEVQAVAILQGEQARRELAARDQGHVEFEIPFLDAGRGDAVGAPDHLVRLGRRLLVIRLRDPGPPVPSGRARRTARA
jgi:hypothetical protein